MRRSLPRDEQATALVETALVLPLMLFLFFAVLEFGNLFSQVIRAEKATEAGVRYAVTADIVANNVPDCGVATAQMVGTPCRLVAGSATWQRICTSTAADCNAAAFAAVVARMQAVYPQIAPENVVIEYSGTGLGFLGRGMPVPNVTVRLQNMNFTFVILGAFVRGAFGGTAPDTIPLPDCRATLPGEDLQS